MAARKINGARAWMFESRNCYLIMTGALDDGGKENQRFALRRRVAGENWLRARDVEPLGHAQAEQQVDAHRAVDPAFAQ